MILGLLFPPFIKRLDFKSKEELQQMPQTEEEHLENQNLDYEDQEKQHPDAEVGRFFFRDKDSKYNIRSYPYCRCFFVQSCCSSVTITISFFVRV